MVIVEVLNSTVGADASKIKLLFGDLNKGALMGERRGITIRSSMDRYFDQDQIGILGTERVDIVVHDIGDASNAGPIVALKAPAN